MKERMLDEPEYEPPMDRQTQADWDNDAEWADGIRTRFDFSAPLCKRWMAIHDDSYDGPGSPIGTGETEKEAVEDLKEQL